MKKTKILLVEDEEFLGLIIKESLETRGFEVEYCRNGEEGIKAFTTNTPDIVLLDIMMPEKDGYTMASEIRAFDKNTPIIFLTAKSQAPDVVKGFELGADDYIKKPFSMEELIVRIKARLHDENKLRTINPERDKYEIGSYVFDVKKMFLHNNSFEKKLTPMEAEILKLLCDNKNQVLERKLVLEKVWGEDNFFNARSMDVFITKLRKYLKEDPNIEIINIRGKGYKLIY